MVTAFGMARRICRVVRLRQVLRDWRNKARLSPSSSSSSFPFSGTSSNDPAGHVAIYVGGCRGTPRRFVIRATYLNHPVFVKLLSEAEEEYGFGHDGPLTVPCNESVFEDAIRTVSCSREMNTIGRRHKAEELQPLLIGLVQKPVWWNPT